MAMARGRTQNAVSQRAQRAVLLSLVLLAALLPNLRSLRYDFVWDDEDIITSKLDVRGPADLARIAGTPFDSFLGESMRQPNYFRPATLLSLVADRALAGNDPGPYHRTNLLLYVSACLFLWLFLLELSGSAAAATAGGLVYAVHPTHPESVCFISGRTDLLAGLFVFASLWLALSRGPRIRNPWLKLLPASGALLIALFSKEVALFASPAIVLALWLRERPLGAGALARAAAPILIADAIYFACRTAVIGLHGGPAVFAVQGTGPQFLTSFAVLARYLPLLFAPIALAARYEVPPLREPNLAFAIGFAAALLLAGGLLVALRRRSKWALPLALLALTLGPLCWVRLIAGALMADRFLFIPSAALAIAVALLPGTTAWFAAGIATPFFLVLLLPRVAVWENDRTLYTSMVRDAPESPHAHAILGGYYYRQHDLPRAIEHQRRAFELFPAYTETLLDLSAAEDEMGQSDSAFAHVRLLLRLRPTYAPAWYALGNYFVRVDRPDSAASAYAESIRLDPKFPPAENNFGVVLERLGRREEAIAHYRRAMAIDSGYVDAANNLGRLGAAGAR